MSRDMAALCFYTTMADNDKKQKSPKISNYEVVDGEVVLSLPERGCVIVQPKAGSFVNVPFPAYLPYGDSARGVSFYSAPSVGTTVQCMISISGSKYLGKVISVGNDTEVDTDTLMGFIQNYYIDDQTASSYVMKGAQAALELVLKSGADWVKCKSAGVDLDIYPGDYDVHDKHGLAGLHIGYSVAQLRGSPTAFVDATSSGDRVRVVGDSVETHTITTEQCIANDYTVLNVAASITEAFGCITTEGDDSGGLILDDVDSERFEFMTKSALPFYRMQHVVGPVVNGEQDLILGVKSDSKYAAHLEYTEPLVLSRRTADLSGWVGIDSAVGIVSVKRPVIPAIHQVEYLPMDEGAAADDDRENARTELRTTYSDATPYKDEDELSRAEKEAREEDMEDQDRITDAILIRLADVLTTPRYGERLLELMRARGFCPSGLREESLKDMKGGDQGNLNLNSQEMSPPPADKVVNPVTGQEELRYNSASFITQEPDGSICICDGYGSEIRMTRGNIYISPAFDLFLRPGRDLSAMVGRHQSYNAQGTCTINSRDSMYIRAEQDLKMAGGYKDNGGKVTISCGSDKKEAGVFVDSLSSISLSAVADICIGRNSHTSDSKDTYTYPSSAGSIVLDAGDSGNVSMHGKQVGVDASKITMLAFTDMHYDGGPATVIDNCSLLDMSPNGALTVYGNVIESNASLILGRGGATEVSLMRGGDNVLTNIAGKSGPVAVQVAGAVSIEKNLHVGGQTIVNGALFTPSVFTVSEVHSGMREEDQRRVFEPVLPVEISLVEQFTVTAGASTGILKDYVLAQAEFAFPEIYTGVSMERMPGMAWQQTTSSTFYWKERVEVSSRDSKKQTECYPGKAIWDKLTVSVFTDKYSKVRVVDNGYVINSDNGGLKQ